MGIASIVLGVAAFVFMLGGVFLWWIPILGALLAFGAPVLALAGCVTGGVGLSRARQEGDSTGLATAGLIVSIIAFVFGLVVAVTCGFCGALCSAATLNPNARYTPNDGGAFWFRSNLAIGDGGVMQEPPAFPGMQGPGQSGGTTPPPAFPPPPIQPGTTQPPTTGAVEPTKLTRPDGSETPGLSNGVAQQNTPSANPMPQGITRPDVRSHRTGPSGTPRDPEANPMPQDVLGR